MRHLLVAALIPANLAMADPVRETSRPCRVERLDHAYAACVEHLAAQRIAAMEAKIGHVLSGLQAAYQPELTALETRYATAQKNWKAGIERGCADTFTDRPRAMADCRLSAVLAREAQLTESLARAADDLGGARPHDIPVPDAVEVLVPLPGVPNGPGQIVRVPLTVPVTPQ